MKLNKFAAILAFIIGVMALFAGGQVILLGKVQDYYVIDWLPIYNLIMGLLTVFVTSILIWKNSRLAMTAVIATLAIQAAFILVLQTAYRDIVAPDSIRATAIRIGIWVIILVLMLIRKVKGNT